MTQVGTYTLERFISDARDEIKADPDPHVHAHRIADHLRQLLAGPEGWLEAKFAQMPPPPQQGVTAYRLHKDDEVGFPTPGLTVLGHIFKGGNQGPIHDHGPSWVVYGVYKGEVTQKRYRRADGDLKGARAGGWRDDQAEGVDIQSLEEFVQKPGEVTVIWHGQQHAMVPTPPDDSLVIRVTGQYLSGVESNYYYPDRKVQTLQGQHPR